MARNNDLVVTAGLNINASVDQIKTDLIKVSELLPTDALTIKCSIDKNSIANIKSQLKGLTGGIKLDIGSDTTINTTAIKNQAKALIEALDLSVPKGKVQEVRDVIQGLINDYQKAFQNGDYNAITKSFDALETYVNQFRKEVKFVNDDLLETQQIIKDIARSGKTFISEKDYNELKYLLDGGRNVNTLLSQAFGVGGWTKDISKANLSWDQKVQQINDIFDKSRSSSLTEIDSGRFNDQINGVIQLVNYLNQTFDQGDEIIKIYGEDIRRELGDQLYSELNKILGMSNQVESEWHDLFDMSEVQQATQSIQTLGNTIQQSLTKYPDISIGENTKASLENAKNVLTEYFNASGIDGVANRVKRAVEDTSGELQRFYVQVERGDKSVETLTYALNEQGTAYEYLGKTIREADNSTDFRRKDIGTQWDIQTQKLQQFIANAEKAGFASTSLKTDIENLQVMLANKGDTSAMNAFLDDFDVARAKLQALNAEARKDNFANALQNKIRKLSVDMQNYAQANERAIESQKKMSTGQTFAEEWARLLSQLAKGASLTDTEIKQLIDDFRNFGREAQANALKGESAFGRFANSFKVLSTYFSASRLIWRTISAIKSAVNELRALNDTIIEIDKVSGRTQENLQALAESSFQVASEFGRTANDYLLGVQEMSRAGFGEKQAEEFAKLGLMAQAAGQLTAEMANEYLIATNAAYKLEGSEEKLNQILDSQNYLANNNAVNMENLAEATKIAGSQAAASGVAVDELTAAVGTMVATTQQGGSQAGRAFKGILMNIQQVKASADDIGDGGADITAESLSKYEKATAALGVSLKEVKNGTLQLRKPMEVLRDLSAAVSKESEGSIKVANLISSVGGKFRGNQLIALLQNWDVYEKMLTEFNSEEAVGSAMREAEKSANGWSGSINKVKNSWTELVQEFANSDNMISILNSVNTIISGLNESAASGALRTISNAFSGILKTVGFLSKELGTIPTILASIAVINSIRGKGLFSNASIISFIQSLNTAKLSTIALNVALTALKATMTLLISAVISALITAFVNLIHAEERAAEAEKELISKFEENINHYNEEEAAIDDVIKKYSELKTSAEDTESIRNDLSKLQEQIIKDYGDEAAAIDLINGKYSEQIQYLNDLKKANAEVFIYNEDNINAYNQALDKLSHAGNTSANKYDAIIKRAESDLSRTADVQFYEYFKELGLITDYIESFSGGKFLGFEVDIEGAEDAETLYKTLDKIAEEYKKFATQKNIFKEDKYFSFREAAVNAKEYYDKYKAIVDQFEKNREIAGFELAKDTQEQFNDLLDKAQELNEQINNTENVEEKFIVSEKLKTVKGQLYELVKGNEELTASVDDLFTAINNGSNTVLENISTLDEAWYATLDDMQKGSFKNISTMVSALQDLSEGKGIAANTFWSLIEFDTEGLLTGAQLAGDKFYITQENMIKLKDQYIQKQIDSINLMQVQNEKQKQIYEDDMRFYQLQIEAWKFSEKPLTNPIYRKEYDELISQLETAKQGAKAFGDVWERNNWLIEYLNQSLGNTIDKQKELESQAKALNKEITALNKELDNYVKAHEAVIDNIVKGIEREQHELEEQKQVLEDELDVLNEQKDTIEETIKNYESVNKLVQDTVEKEIDALEKQKKSIEDTYNKRIDALKSENEEREDALEYAEKLRNLENARNNKRRVYDETRGWRYESVKDDVVKAENELAEFENSQQIKALEKERDSITESLDEQIDAKKEYAELWKEVLDAIQTEEEELLAVEILGADWREKIANGDIEVMEKFRTEYLSHNTALQNLTKNEIKLKEEAIKAKDAEIDAKKKQAQAWKDYKTEITTAVTEIKNANEGYMSQLGQIELNEGSSLEDRERVFETFKNNVTGYIDQIAGAQSQLDYINSLQENLGGDYHYNIEVNGKEDLEEAAAASLALALGAASSGALGGTLGIGAAMSVANSPIPDMTNDIINAITDVMNHIRGFSQGGVVDRTGLAMLHGRQNAPELIFNAKDSSKLYDMVHNTPNLIASIISDARKLAGFKVGNNTSNTSSVVNFHIDKIVTDNPEDFSKQMEKYYQTKLTQSYTMRQ